MPAEINKQAKQQARQQLSSQRTRQACYERYPD
jgi:hypothetical protein